jgi:hypothetical protein
MHAVKQVSNALFGHFGRHMAFCEAAVAAAAVPVTVHLLKSTAAGDLLLQHRIHLTFSCRLFFAEMKAMAPLDLWLWSLIR